MSAEKRFVVCVRNDEYEGALELRKIYEVLDDADTEPHDQIRVIDESGEDYLYPRHWFLPIELPHNIEEAIVEIAHRITHEWDVWAGAEEGFPRCNGPRTFNLQTASVCVLIPSSRATCGDGIHSRRELVLSETLEAIGGQLGIDHGRFDVAMAHVRLNRTRVDSVIREGVPLRVTHHVRMDGGGEPGSLPGALDDVMDGARRERSSTLARKHEA